MKTSALLACLALLPFVVPAAPACAEEDEPPDRGPWVRLQRMDTDGDGKISREEFRGPERFFERLDADGDGHVTKAEAERLRSRMGGRGGPRGARGMQGRGRGLGLQALDTDEDGSISKAEWDAFFAKADENEDGILQDEEWRAAVSERALHDPAPKVGDRAPPVKAKLLDFPVHVDLGSPKRTTVLIFGSWT